MNIFGTKMAPLAGFLVALVLPAIAYADSVERDVKAYLEDKNPQLIAEYPDAFVEIYEKHAPVIKESTLTTVVYYFGEADEHTLEDIATLTSQSVTAAIAKSRSDGNEDDLAAFITDAVCGSFKGGLHAAYKQVTSASKAVEGGLQAALGAGVEPDYASTAVTRGIDTCLDERLDYAVAMVIGGLVNGYIAPYPAYLPATLGSGDVNLLRSDTENYPGFDTNVCVSNCI